MEAPISLQIFGPTTLVDGDGCARRMTGKSARILAVLGLRVGHPVHKDELAEAVWDGAPPVSFRQTLESDVCVLRHRTGLGAGPGSALTTVSGGYLLAPDRITVDLHLRRAIAGKVATASSVGVLAASRTLVRDHADVLLEDEPFWEWAHLAREEWAETLARSCLHASRAALIAGEPVFALDAASAALAAQPASETATVQVMRAQWWLGRHNDALRTYLDLKDRLMRELGEAPQQEAQDTYLAVLRDKGSSPSSEDAERQLHLVLALLRQTLDAIRAAGSPEDDTALPFTAPRTPERMEALES